MTDKQELKQKIDKLTNIPFNEYEFGVPRLVYTQIPEKFVLMDNGSGKKHISLYKRIHTENEIMKGKGLCGQKCKNPQFEFQGSIYTDRVCLNCLRSLDVKLNNYLFDSEKEEFYHPLENKND